MQDSTQAGDSAVEVTNVDTAAAALIQRRQARQEPQQSDQPEPEVEINEPDEEIVDEYEDDGEELQDLETGGETDDDEPESDGEEARFQNVAELAEATGMSLEDFLSNINLETTVNDKTETVSLADLQKGFQLESVFTANNKALKAKERQFDEDVKNFQASSAAAHQQLGMLLNQAQAELTREFQGVDWNALEQSNPGEWTAKRQKFGERQTMINNLMSKGQALLQQQMAQNQELTGKKAEAYAQEQEQLLLTKVKDWKDPKVRERERGKVADLLLATGYDASELGNNLDHRIVVLARQAMLGNELSKQGKQTARRVKKTPKLLKPGVSRNVEQKGSATARKLTEKAQKTGDRDDIAAALVARRRAKRGKRR